MSAIYRGGSQVSLLGRISPDGCGPAMDLRSFIQCSIGVDIGVPLLEVLFESVGTTPLEITAVRTQIGTVCLPVVSCNALRLCIYFSANIA